MMPTLTKPALGGGDEGGIAMDVARAWMSLFSYGVEPSDIKKTLHRKSRELFKNPPGHK